ncbi:hypothetical protein JY490_05565 [Serratia marcescens]|uniref:hypothetical protein n=1 Tax=Serratia marcescens TaxID=615 RepID=UPI001867FB9E|nr:hypothetical protein [Serratia marcescens]MBN5273465.1 hypothetical protein [Serratia marcescens]MBN5277861.1 hypothetical protein [Serratia marcescens]MBN5305326.1 hypothetical protein [Serratia marcescens]MBN5363503.1 hypothetical protein [Serratia marcescens]MBN5423843.1 hypothetical protein [Serratia marcescens]
MISANFNDFFEKMDHEFRNIEIEHDKSGYRVDKTGIKHHCKYNELKSVDYLYEQENKLCLVEFSDLARQHLSVLDRVRMLNESNLDKSQRKQYIKGLHKEISSEMRTKYLHSLSILTRMPDCIKDVPEWAQRNKGKLLIVVAPTSEDISDEDKTDIVRVLEKLKDDLTRSIPDDLFVSVKVVAVHSFFA